MCNAAGSHAEALELLQREHALLLTFAIGEVQAGTDRTRKRPSLVKARNTDIEDPSVIPVRPSEPVFHLKPAAGVEGLLIRRNTPIEVLRVHVFSPAIAELLFESSACVIRSEERRVGKECRSRW